MLYSFFAVDEEPTDKTGIDWLDVAIALANTLVAQILMEIEQQYRRLPESGNGAVLKTDDTVT